LEVIVKPIMFTTAAAWSVTMKARNADGTRRPAARQSRMRWSVGAVASAV
jgi:hypothetical protein